MKKIILLTIAVVITYAANAQEEKVLPVAELTTGGVPPNAVKLDKKTGYAMLKSIEPDQTFTEEEIEGEFYKSGNIIISYFGGKSASPFKANELEETRYMEVEMANYDPLSPKIVKSYNNYRVLISVINLSVTRFYNAISNDLHSYLNFSITAKAEDQQAAAQLGENILKAMKFK